MNDRFFLVVCVFTQLNNSFAEVLCFTYLSDCRFSDLTHNSIIHQEHHNEERKMRDSSEISPHAFFIRRVNKKLKMFLEKTKRCSPPRWAFTVPEASV